MRLLLLAVAVLAVLAATATAKHRSHGCNTHACEVRVCKTTACRDRVADRRPMGTAVASWYGPGLYGNPLACGGRLTTSTFGVAHKTLPCGTRVRLCARRCTTARVIDRGPYVAGRTFDLTAPVRAAIGSAPVAVVRYRIIG